jgi:hypothetical protein
MYLSESFLYLFPFNPNYGHHCSILNTCVCSPFMGKGKLRHHTRQQANRQCSSWKIAKQMILKYLGFRQRNSYLQYNKNNVSFNSNLFLILRKFTIAHLKQNSNISVKYAYNITTYWDIASCNLCMADFRKNVSPLFSGRILSTHQLHAGFC